jgi:hypothetical protein
MMSIIVPKRCPSIMEMTKKFLVKKRLNSKSRASTIRALKTLLLVTA